MPNELGSGEGIFTLGAGAPIDNSFSMGADFGPMGQVFSLSSRAVSNQQPGSSSGGSSGGGSGGGFRYPSRPVQTY